MVRGDFTKLRSRDGARSARLGKDNFGRVWEEHAGDFIDRFIAQGSIKEEDFSAGEVFFPESGQLARRAGIVRAIGIDIRARLQFFQASRPDGSGDAFLDRASRDPIATRVERTGGRDSIQRVLQLKTSGQLRGELYGPA